MSDLAPSSTGAGGDGSAGVDSNDVAVSSPNIQLLVPESDEAPTLSQLLSNAELSDGDGGAGCGRYGPWSLPDPPKFDLKTDKGRAKASREMMMILGTICKLTVVIMVDFDAFRKSETAAIQILDVVNGKGLPTDFAPGAPSKPTSKETGNPTEEGKPKFDTIEALAEYVLGLVNDVAWDIAIFRLLVGDGFLDTAFLDSINPDSPRPKVPSVSPREIYLWCLLNTKRYRRDVEDSARSESPREDVSAIIGILPYLTPTLRPDALFKWFPERLARRIDACTAQVFFVCSGIDPDGGLLHPTTHIGASLERFKSWPEFWNLRRSARKKNIGSNDVAKWLEFFNDLKALEQAAGIDKDNPVERLLFRKKLVAGEMPDEYKQQYQQKLARIRDLHRHLGQAFSEREEGWVAINSCYLCQGTEGYTILDPGQDPEFSLM
ncbi:hypothetical protein F5144DRAFT_632158 [Chaetomium tenue]|uniref:Uncharacterized protein n=1 Tax=Chaetomium tenue TaxID=1854479 RepID=A0ACB7NYN6_9PEZI|nr:hypothetical protein F5144DRAFT_632158 [Chaetomium globosum]